LTRITEDMNLTFDTEKALGRLRDSPDLARAADELVAWARELTSCDVALLRVVEPEQVSHAWIPACIHSGGSDAFIRDETLVSADECLCGHVITGAMNRRLPFVTEGGAFVWGRTGTLPAEFSWRDTGVLRGRCVSEGYESVAIFPIPGPHSTLGCLHLADPRPDLFASSAAIIEEVCRKAGPLLAERAALDQGRVAFSAIQSVLAPPLHLVVPGLRLGVSFQGADVPQQAGGDFYDIMDHNSQGSHEVWFVVGDYSGKGMEAMGMAASARSVLSRLSREAESPADLLARGNEELLPLLAPDRFVAVSLCRLEPEHGTLEVALAGHSEPLLFARGGEPQPVPTRYNPPLGASRGCTFATSSLSLKAGDLLVVATDGVTEARRAGRLFGSEGVSKIVRRLAPCGSSGPDPSTIAREVCAASIRHHDKKLPGDDRLVLAAEIL